MRTAAICALSIVSLFTAAIRMQAQKPRGYHAVEQPKEPNLYQAYSAGCGGTEDCTIAYEDILRVGTVPSRCCTLLVVNGDGFTGADAVLNYEIDLNGKRVLFNRGSRANAKTHVTLKKKNSVKLIVTGEIFRRMEISIFPDDQ